MSIQLVLAFIITVFLSVTAVAIIILLGWFLLWKALLSKFKLVRELFGMNDSQWKSSKPQKQKDYSKQIKDAQNSRTDIHQE